MTCLRCHCAECRRARVNARVQNFLVSRETSSPPVDPDAEQLAIEVVDLRDELRAIPS